MASPDTLPETLSVEEFERLSDSTEYRLELVGGMLVREPPPGGLHAMISGNIVAALSGHCRAQEAGLVFVDAGYVLGPPGLVRAPDVSVVLAAHMPPEGPPEGFWRRAPDLAVEVVSPSNTAVEMEQKVEEYLAAGSAAVWVVYPRTRKVLVHRAGGALARLGEDDEIEGGDALPGFRAVVRDFFADC